MSGKDIKNKTAAVETFPAAVPFDLENELATEMAEPQLITFKGKNYSVRVGFTGAEVIEFSKLLVYHPLPDPIAQLGKDGRKKLSTFEQIKISEDHMLAVAEHYNQYRINVFEFLLAEGDATELWGDMADLAGALSKKLTNRIYQLSGLVNAQGEFLAF